MNELILHYETEVIIFSSTEYFVHVFAIASISLYR